MAKILIVDDEHNIRMMMRLALQHAGHQIETASDGQEGLDRFGEGDSVDLVLLDQRMPGMEGLEVLKAMRRRNPDAKIIMATAFGTIDLAVEAMKSGATDFLRKPFTAETLRGAVQTALQERVPTASSPSVTFGSTTLNGFRIEFQSGTGRQTPQEFQQAFLLRDATGESASCLVTLPAYVSELIKAQTDREELPGGDRFWTAICEEALANYLWQNAAFPPEGSLRIEEYSAGLRRFVAAVLTA